MMPIKKSFFYGLFILTLLFTYSVANADNSVSRKSIKIYGRVLDVKGEALVGASIVVKGSRIGTSANENGEYTLYLDKRTKAYTLIFSFIGMENKEYEIKASKLLNVVLEEDNKLESVVVNGFYNQAKETFTGSAVTIKGEDLVNIAPTNLIAGLTALTPGLRIVENNVQGSNPNAIPSLILRGATTLITNSDEEGINNPLIILDGVEISMAELYDLDIFEIKRVDVLKDAAATILYGEQGANGVILIERKNVDNAKLKLRYNFTPSFSIPDLSSLNLTNAKQKLELERLAGIYDMPDGSMDEAYYYKLQNVRRGVDTKWIKAPLRAPFSHNHNISLGSHHNNLDFRVSANLNDQYGVMKGDKRRRGSLGFSLGYRLKNKLNINFSSYFSMVNSKASPYGNFIEYVKMNPYNPIFDDKGELIPVFYFDPKNETGLTTNPLYRETLSSFNKNSSHSITNALSMRYNIYKGLYLTASANLVYSWGDRDIYTSPKDPKYFNTVVSRRGEYRFSNSKKLASYGQFVLNYARALDAKGSMLRLSAGGNIQYSRNRSRSATGKGFLKDYLSDLAFATSYPLEGHPTGFDYIATGLGFFVNANAGFRNRYFIDLSYRTSASSRFGSNNSFAPFWAYGIGWNIHREEFAKNWQWLDKLTIRYSGGYTGSSNFRHYQANTIYQYDINNSYFTGLGAVPTQMGNPNLKWQRTFNQNVGLTSAFWHNRVNFSFDFYSNTTYDMLMPIELPPSVGTKTMNVNFGQINNKGVDFQLSVHILKSKDWFWNMTITGDHVIDKIKNISKSLKNTAIDNKNDALQPKLLFRENGSQYDIYAMKSAGIDPATGREIYIKKNGDYTFHYDPREKVAVGNRNPTLQGTWMNTLRYKGFTLNVVTSYTFGGDIYNSTLQGKVENIDIEGNVDERAFTQRWQKPGDLKRFLGIKGFRQSHASERFVQERNELYIRNIQLMYDFMPKFITRLGLRKLGIGIGVSDIARISSVKFERGTAYPYCRGFNIIIRPTF